MTSTPESKRSREPALVAALIGGVFAIGAALITIVPDLIKAGEPVVQPNREQAQSHGAGPGMPAVEEASPRPDAAQGIQEHAQLTPSNIVEVLEDLGFRDFDVARDMNFLVDALAGNGVRTKGELRAVVEDRYALAKLKQIYIEELKRDPSAPIDPLAVAIYGSYLHKNEVSDTAVEEIRRTVRSSEEYRRLHESQ